MLVNGQVKMALHCLAKAVDVALSFAKLLSSAVHQSTLFFKTKLAWGSRDRLRAQ